MLRREPLGPIDEGVGDGQAEELALTADLFFGPAHNNLGVLFLKQDKLYEAANDFEWTKKLLPGQPDPRVNLGLVMERAGRYEEGFARYEAALEVWPNYLPALQGLASQTLRAGNREDPWLQRWLEEIGLRGEGAWQVWARSRLARARRSEQPGEGGFPHPDPCGIVILPCTCLPRVPRRRGNGSTST